MSLPKPTPLNKKKEKNMIPEDERSLSLGEG
jgi:hypothetical protein